MTTDFLLNYKFNTWKFQAQTWEEHVVYRNCFCHSEQFLYTTCSPHVLQKEELRTKIYLYFAQKPQILIYTYPKYYLQRCLAKNSKEITSFLNKCSFNFEPKIRSRQICSSRRRVCDRYLFRRKLQKTRETTAVKPKKCLARHKWPLVFVRLACR